MVSFIKKCAVFGFIAVVTMVLYALMSPGTGEVQAAPAAPLYQVGCPSADGGDIGVPTWLCTQLTYIKNNENALRTSVNTVDSTQASSSLPIAGGTATGPIKINNSGAIIGTSVAGITTAVNGMIIQTADAGVIHVKTVGNDIRLAHQLAGIQMFRVTNDSDGGVDSGNYTHLEVAGTVVQKLPSVGFYFSDAGIGADGAYGVTTTFAAESPHTAFFPLEMYFVVNGSFSTGEIVTLRITAQDDNDAGYALGTTTFDAGVTASEYPLYNLWYAIAALVNDKKLTFQHKPIQRLVFDAKSDAGTTVLSLDITVAAIQN